MLTTCIDPIRIQIDLNNPSELVVDAILTDEVGTQFIRLFNSVNVYEDLRKPQPFTAKEVGVIEDQNKLIIFDEIESGVYASDSNFRIVPGLKYKLMITTYAGEVYESSEEMIQASGAIDSLYFLVRTVKPLNFKSQYFADIFINSRISDVGNKYFKWTVHHTYKVQTMPNQPICCDICWVTEYEDNVKLSDNRFISNGRIQGSLVATIPLTNGKLIDKIKVYVEQHGLSQTAFNFWKTVQDQQTGLTSLFQPAVGSATSNINKKGTSKKALGIFYVKSSIKKDMVITHSEISKFVTLPAENIVRGSCLKYKNSSSTKPMDWD